VNLLQCSTQWESDAGGPLYRVRWKGFPPIEDTWEPIDSFTLETRKTVRRFVRSYKKMQETVILLLIKYVLTGLNLLTRFLLFIQLCIECQ
jgi:hypothetical protein